MAADLDNQMRAVYERLLKAWNDGDGDAFAEQFADAGEVIGFDGSQVKGREAIAKEMNAIFADHETGRYVGIVKEVSELGSDAAVLRAVAGVVPAGESDVNPALNSVQALIAQRGEGGWSIVLYQNTPAQFHGRPELSEALTAELRSAL